MKRILIAALALLLGALPAIAIAQETSAIAQETSAATAPEASAATASDEETYTLLGSSRLEVKTGKAGLLGFVGHDHIIRAGQFEGTVHYRPDSAGATRISIRILTHGLEVLTPPDTAEIRKVTASMREEVLHVDQYPEMTFVSKAITGKNSSYRVTADFTMHGTTREISVPVTVEFIGDTLLATSRFELKQTDFGIQPYKGGPAGTVKVADKVEFRITARALRQPAP